MDKPGVQHFRSDTWQLISRYAGTIAVEQKHSFRYHAEYSEVPYIRTRCPHGLTLMPVWIRHTLPDMWLLIPDGMNLN